MYYGMSRDFQQGIISTSRFSQGSLKFQQGVISTTLWRRQHESACKAAAHRKHNVPHGVKPQRGWRLRLRVWRAMSALTAAEAKCLTLCYSLAAPEQLPRVLLADRTAADVDHRRAVQLVQARRLPVCCPCQPQLAHSNCRHLPLSPPQAGRKLAPAALQR